MTKQYVCTNCETLSTHEEPVPVLNSPSSGPTLNRSIVPQYDEEGIPVLNAPSTSKNVPDRSSGRTARELMLGTLEPVQTGDEPMAATKGSGRKQPPDRTKGSVDEDDDQDEDEDEAPRPKKKKMKSSGTLEVGN
ncbi:MAG TPA: hypothetical protein VGG64_09390 [Pirellulales bacterium]|jgi:hypothetical protein